MYRIVGESDHEKQLVLSGAVKTFSLKVLRKTLRSFKT